MDYSEALRNGSAGNYFWMKKRIVELEETCSEFVSKNFELKAENFDMRSLVMKMHDALQKFCDAEEPDGKGCPLLQEDRSCQCMLRDIEDWMRELEIEVEE